MIGDVILPYPTWLNQGDNAWQLTAATLVGLMSVPGLVVLYGGVMQKRWSVNSMMLAFAALRRRADRLGALGLQHGLRTCLARHLDGRRTHEFFGNFIGQTRCRPEPRRGAGPGDDPASVTSGPDWHFPQSTLVYFQFVFAAITPLLMLGSVLGRINFKAWMVFVPLWITFFYTVNAFLIWGGGWLGAHGALDFSGGYVIHLAAGVAGFVAAAVIGPATCPRP